MKTCKIKDICDKASSNLKQKDVAGKNGKYAVYGASGIISYIDTYQQDKDYIAIVKDGSGIGRVTFNPAYTSVIGTMQYILPKKNFNIRYIGYCLQSLDLSKYKQGAAIPHIYFRDYGERIVSIEEDALKQEEIVTYLDTSFARIDAIKANAEKELEEAKKLFAAALKRSLSPTLSQGEGDREWQMKTLSEIGESRVGPFGSLLHKKDYIEGGTPLINPMHIVANKVKADYSFTVTDEKKEELSSYVMQKDDIVIGRRGEMGRCAIINEDSAGFICGTGSIFFRPNINIVSPRYLQILLSSEEAKKKMTNIASGATMLNLSSKALSSLSFLFPPLTVQQTIVTHLDTLSEKVRQLQSNYEKISSECDALKQAILRDTFE